MKNTWFVSGILATGAIFSVVANNVHALESSGYVIDSRGLPAKSGTGLCWRTGYWTPSMATAECDRDLARAMPVAKAQPPKTSELPRVAEMPKAEKLSISSDGLFAFGKSTLTPESKTTLDSLTTKLIAGGYSKISIIGHTDRLGSKKSNQRISAERAQAVKAYLVGKGLGEARIDTIGKGSTQPLASTKTCKGSKSPAVIACLQPDRRVEIIAIP